ncbi:expression site-associated gene 2 (ESAG2) protein, putative [Trypanosoma brucei gambiense DAL972]|uniref:Expression site-associated gene 2 (ESAG2) protein, putative n=1 Tax=Trypanosoma brucei gambiense (strain MHOM/CI/86/DAL972) TaxID=679716 RepID=D0AA17_TRYB9|nr:expression site-associated gene 2 (ESAG2) protein, putative [Trypanosoma brucei gambiense DAL972]CBH18518.1 expression site-associated gene 2 (ESAG2) protein, putative [Trypanosoma brucei gambiense DAL972]|eukprot:XP_011780782.1 expression site-associated gene 2 (ESAG2) protein, putative [Trypanosoma brucei gambiense DAL972]
MSALLFVVWKHLFCLRDPNISHKLLIFKVRMEKLGILLLATTTFVVGTTTENKENLRNQQEFNQLCRILRLVEGDPGQVVKEPPNLGILIEVLQKMVKATFVKESSYQEAVDAREKWKSADSTVETKNIMDKQRADDLVRYKITHEKLKKLLAKAKMLVSRIKEERYLAYVSRNAALEKMAKVVYGSSAEKMFRNETEFEKFLANSQGTIVGKTAKETCGRPNEKSNNPGMAGYSLVGDFFCLCVGEKNNATLCDKSFGGPNDEHKWTKVMFGDKLLDFAAGWFKIRDLCYANATSGIKDVVTPENISTEIVAFNKMLGRQRDDVYIYRREAESYRQYVLGRVHQVGFTDDGICTGEHQHMCVNYAQCLVSNKGIPWQLKLMEAEEDLEDVEKHNMEVHVLIGRLDKLIEKIKKAAEQLSQEMEGIDVAVEKVQLLEEEIEENETTGKSEATAGELNDNMQPEEGSLDKCEYWGMFSILFGVVAFSLV